MPVITALFVKTLQLIDYVLSYLVGTSVVTVGGGASCGFTYTIYNAELTPCGFNAVQDVFTLWEGLTDLTHPLQLLMSPVYSLMTYVGSFYPV